MATTNLGKVSVTPKGEYDPLITYERLDVISHNGSSYIVKQASTGVTPIEGEFYALIAEKGDGGSFVKKAYKTYAAMDADKVNIPANSSVDVTNDPDESKNGAYIYDGAAFTRSQYDSKVVTDKIIADTAIAVQEAINNTAIEGGVLADTFVTVTKKAANAIPRSLRDINNENVYISDFINVVEGVDVTTGVQAFFDYCALNNKTAMLNKACEVSDTLYASCNLDGTNGGLVYPLGYNKTGLVVAAEKSENTNVRLNNKRLVIPSITSKNSLGNDWSSHAGSVGVKLVNVMSSEVHVPEVFGFERNIIHLANGTDANYNTYFFGRSVFSKRCFSIIVDGTVSRASANQNTFHGGRFAVQNVTTPRVPDIVLVHAEVKGATSSSCNNNVFVNPSIEGSADEYAMLFENSGANTNGVSYNTVINPRLETGGVSGKRIGFKGVGVRWNGLLYGYGVNNNTVVNELGAGANNYTGSLGQQLLVGSSVTGAQLALANEGGVTQTNFAVFPPGLQNTDYNDVNNSTISMTSQYIYTGKYGELFRRFKISTQSGALSWGGGATDTDTMLKRLSIGNLQANGKLLAVGGIGVGNTSVATTQPTTPTRKMRIYDETGAAIGWIPIYEDIT